MYQNLCFTFLFLNLVFQCNNKDDKDQLSEFDLGIPSTSAEVQLKIDISTEHSIERKELLKIILDNYNDNIMHSGLKINSIDFEYWSSVFGIVCILMKHVPLKDLNIQRALISALEAMDNQHVLKHNKIHKELRSTDEIRKEHLSVIEKFWRTAADKVFQSDAVDNILDENIGNVVFIPQKRWISTLTSDTCGLQLKYTILVLVYILNCFKLQFNIFESGDSARVIQNIIIDEPDLPDYVVKTILFLACIEKKPSIIKSLTLPIERCSDLRAITTDHDHFDRLLKNWDHFESYRFKLFIVSKYLGSMEDKRKKCFEKFAQSNEDLIYTLINMMLDTPMDKSTLNQIRAIITLKIHRDKLNTIVDYLWNSLGQLLKNHDTVFHDNVINFSILCLQKLPTILRFENHGNLSENSEKLNKILHLSDLLTKFLVKIEIQKDNLDLLIQLQSMLFLILKYTKKFNNSKIIKCSLKSNIPDMTIKTAMLLSDIDAMRSLNFTSSYLSFTNDIIDLCKEHSIPLTINFNYNFFFKQIINVDLVHIGQLLKLLRTLFLSLHNPLLMHTIRNFQTNFIANEFLYEHVYTFLLNLLMLHDSHSTHILGILILMLKVRGDAIFNNPFNYTIVKVIIKHKMCSEMFLHFVNELVDLFLKNYIDTSRCIGKPRRVKIVELIEDNISELSQQFGERSVLTNLQQKVSEKKAQKQLHVLYLHI